MSGFWCETVRTTNERKISSSKISRLICLNYRNGSFDLWSGFGGLREWAYGLSSDNESSDERCLDSETTKRTSIDLFARIYPLISVEFVHYPFEFFSLIPRKSTTLTYILILRQTLTCRSCCNSCKYWFSYSSDCAWSDGTSLISNVFVTTILSRTPLLKANSFENETLALDLP